jgi:hypothetical protein
MAVIRLGVGMVTAAVALAAGLRSVAAPMPAPVSPFGGAVAVHIAHVGRIERNVGALGAALRQVRCSGSPAGTECFVARLAP